MDAIWCNQHQQLQDILTGSGAELTLDRVLPAGSGVMKVIEMVNDHERTYIATEQIQQRMQRK